MAKSIKVNANAIINRGIPIFNLESNFFWSKLNSSAIVILELLSAVSPLVIGQTTIHMIAKNTPIGSSNAVTISFANAIQRRSDLWLNVISVTRK